MAFRFRKIYADLVTDDGTVVVAYLARTDAWGLRSGAGGLELYRPDGSREVIRSRSPGPLRPPDGDHPVELRLEMPTDTFRLRYEPSPPPWSPGPSPLPGLAWSVRVARARVTGTWTRGRSDMVGTGYVDWVELSRPTRTLGLRRIEWGRIHTARSTSVFLGISSRDGSWHRAARWDRSGAGEPRVRDDVRFRAPDGGPAGLECRGDREFDAVLAPQRVLHCGPAIDRARSPGLIERLAFRLITGPCHETRWVSRVYRPGSPAPIGWAVHEVVRFGD